MALIALEFYSPFDKAGKEGGTIWPKRAYIWAYLAEGIRHIKTGFVIRLISLEWVNYRVFVRNVMSLQITPNYNNRWIIGTENQKITKAPG